jgi:hypothetical protein
MLPQEFGERRYSAMLDDLNRFQEVTVLASTVYSAAVIGACVVL